MKIELNTIYNMDCLEGMKAIPDGSVDAIICDLPYGTTDCKWDSIIPFDKLWEQYNRILKPQGSVVLFGSEPFSSLIRMSNLQHFKYDWIWHKTTTTGFQHAKNMPLKDYEIISVFSNASMGHANLLGEKRMTYNPQGIVRVDKVSKNTKNKWGNIAGNRPSHKEEFITEFANYPTMTLEYAKDSKGFHPTQKPVALLEYLIKTYTNEGETILDNCMGSGTSAIAAIRTKRNYIGFELNEEYYRKSLDRIQRELSQPSLF